jgi:hypothetical protein
MTAASAANDAWPTAAAASSNRFSEVDGDNRTPPALETLPSSGPSAQPEPILAVSAIEATATK